MIAITVKIENARGEKKVFIRYFLDIGSAKAYEKYIKSKQNYTIVKTEKVN